MKITKMQIPIRDLVNGYDNDVAAGHVVGYGGKLDIRPAYQREFVYNDKQQKEVMRSVLNGFPLNTMYWVKKADGTYELMDGQQRTISICKYVCDKGFSVEVPTVSKDVPLSFGALQTNAPDIADAILNYPLDVYVCEGSTSEKLAWFRTINIAGEELTSQELRNAIYAGPFVSSAKRYFSRDGGLGVAHANWNYTDSKTPLLAGSMIRQEYLETALAWHANAEGQDNFCDKCDWTIDAYLDRHQTDANAKALFDYFMTVIDWVRNKFKVYRKELKGLPWGEWYYEYQSGSYVDNIISKSGMEIEDEIQRLLADEELEGTKVKGIYQYIVTGEEKYLTKRQFDKKTAYAQYEAQHHKCPLCQQEGNEKEYAFNEMEADHIDPWSRGGKTEPSNCQMLCKHHNRMKSAN